MDKKNTTVVVVEDETDIREVLIYNLKREGYQVSDAANGEQGLKLIRRELPDLVLLDLMLPGLDGLKICRMLKNEDNTCDIPIIMVTAKGEESDIVVGLEMGADDYVSKPFSTRELIARVQAVLRRRQTGPADRSRVKIMRDGLEIDPEKHEIKVDGQAVAFTLTEFRLLHFLAANPGRVFTRDHLISRIMGEENFVVDRNIDVHIQAVRKKLGDRRRLIETIRGIGYRFAETEEN
ncbi:MAG: response regulator transcription factor [Deltaproteobacteria bacterium]|nr:response regulator transcription factor [Deltaproteobacteria bacterium]